jgi:hypothetical protein
VLQQRCYRHFGRQLSQGVSTRIAEKWSAAINVLAIPGISYFPKARNIINRALIVSAPLCFDPGTPHTCKW